MILDASVASKWFLRGETFEKESLRLKADFEDGKVSLLAPKLMLYEVGNAIWKREDVKLEEALELVKLAHEYLSHILVDPTVEDLETSMRIAKTFNLTLYDASYAALAVNRRELLVTADDHLYNKLLASRLPALHIRDY